MAYAVVAHPVAQVAEVGAHEGKPVVGHDVALGVGILVKAIQVAVGGKPTEDGARVPTTAKGNIDIHAMGVYVQPVDALLEQYGNVIGACCGYHRMVVGGVKTGHRPHRVSP